jgi:AmiR/NasT family two-component response regulator
MHSVYRIAIADDDRETLALLRASLLSSGHQVVAEVTDGEKLIEACLRTSPDLVITEVTLAGIDVLRVVERMLDSRDVAILILSRSVNDEIIDRTITVRPVAYLLKPFREEELVGLISVTMQRFQELQALREESANTRQALEDRKSIERAKGIIMAKRAIDEQTAFRHLQKLARDNRQKLIVVAESIILAEQAFGS